MRTAWYAECNVCQMTGSNSGDLPTKGIHVVIYGYTRVTKGNIRLCKPKSLSPDRSTLGSKQNPDNLFLSSHTATTKAPTMPTPEMESSNSFLLVHCRDWKNKCKYYYSKVWMIHSSRNEGTKKGKRSYNWKVCRHGKNILLFCLLITSKVFPRSFCGISVELFCDSLEFVSPIFWTAPLSFWHTMGRKTSHIASHSNIYYNILYTILYYTILYYTILYYTIL